MIDTAGTICKAAGLIKEKGAKSVRAVCAHGILSGKAYETIDSSVLEEVVISDSIPQKQQNDKIKILSVAGLFAKAVRRVHSHESISELFI
jgi:ribose-phosphate pyrophosphokinase